MHTLERRQHKHDKDPVKDLAAGKGSKHRTFFVALGLFVLLNVILLLSSFASQKRDLSEVLSQARQEQSAGIPSRHSWSWWLSKLYLEQAQAPDVVVFGSSLLGSAHTSVDAQYLFQLIDVLTHRRMAFLEDQVSKRIGQKVSIFSLGSPGEMISDSYVLSKGLFTAGHKPKMVIATIAPRDFVDSTLAFPAVTDHYKFFSNYLDLSNVSKYAYPDFFARLGAETDRLPLKRVSKLLFNQNSESAKGDWNQCESCRIEPGKAVVPAQAVPRQVDNSKEYEERFRDISGPNYASEMHFFRRWLSELRGQGIAVMIVCMPTTQGNRQLLPPSFWQRFRSDVSSACKESNADLMDLSDSGLFVQSDYLDTVHLNAYGGVRLFPVIAERLSLFKAGVAALKSTSNGTKQAQNGSFL